MQRARRDMPSQRPASRAAWAAAARKGPDLPRRYRKRWFASYLARHGREAVIAASRRKDAAQNEADSTVAHGGNGIPSRKNTEGDRASRVPSFFLGQARA